jgi:type VI secretion system protein ImpJ
MYLSPHHFQVQSRYFEDSNRFATSSLWVESFGLVGCDLDPEALRNGTVSVIHARGVFPDGLAFNMPECDPLPEARANVGDTFPPNRDSMTVYLAITSRAINGLNCIEANGSMPADIRYVAETALRHDETTGLDEKPVRLGRKNVHILFDTESLEGKQTIAVARVIRDGSGHFIFDPLFIPPCVQISASQRLMTVLHRLVEILDDKAASISRGGHAGGKSWAEYSTRDIANFWFLHAVNTAVTPLRHLLVSKRGHPEELYSEMARLGGALCTFAIESHPRNVPLYDHLNLTDTFDALDRHIRQHLETIVPTNCISIPLQPGEKYFWNGAITDQRVLDRSRWVLAIKSPVGEVNLISKTPQLVKVCSTLFIRKLVEKALPGLGMTHLQIPPSAISTRADTQYFSISKAGPCWDHMVQTRQVGVYVPGELPDPTLELLVVLES